MIQLDEFMIWFKASLDYPFTTNFLWKFLLYDMDEFNNFNLSLCGYGGKIMLQKGEDLYKFIYCLANKSREERLNNPEYCSQLLSLNDMKPELIDTLQGIKGISFWDVKYAISQIMTDYFKDNKDLLMDKTFQEYLPNLEAYLAEKWLKSDVTVPQDDIDVWFNDINKSLYDKRIKEYKELMGYE